MSLLPGINIVGFVSGNLGLGVIARQVIAALLSRGHAVATLDLDPGLGRTAFDRSLDALKVPGVDELPHHITIWIVGADQLVQRAIEVCRSPSHRARLNAMYVWWELPHVPPSWQLAAGAFDALIAGSEFVQAAFANAQGRVPVLLAGTPVPVPAQAARNADRYREGNVDFIALTGFEPASDPMRKNPFGSIRAFQSAFGKSTRARLLIKLNNAGSDPRAVALVGELAAEAARDDRLVIIKDRLSHADLMDLYGSCDVTMSLHRSEGLGLMPLEGMRMGTPAIATGWSGNMTYMTQANSIPVRYALGPVQETSVHYAAKVSGVSSFWAEPDVAHAAEALQWLTQDRARLRALSMQAADAARNYHEAAMQLSFVYELAALHARRSIAPGQDREALGDELTRRIAERKWAALTPAQRLKRRLGWRAAGLKAIISA